MDHYTYMYICMTLDRKFLTWGEPGNKAIKWAVSLSYHNPQTLNSKKYTEPLQVLMLYKALCGVTACA